MFCTVLAQGFSVKIKWITKKSGWLFFTRAIHLGEVFVLRN